MPESDNISIGADFTQAVRTLKDLENALRSSGREMVSFAKKGGIVNTSFQEIDGIETATERVKTFGEAVDSAGRKYKVAFSGSGGKAVDNVTVKVEEARRSLIGLRKETETYLKTQAQVAKQNIGQKAKQNESFREMLIPNKLLAEAPTGAQNKLLKSYGEVLEVQTRVDLKAKELDEVLSAFFSNKPKTFILGQQDFYEALLKNRDVVQKINADLIKLGETKAFSDKFKNVIEPTLPKLAPDVKGSKQEQKLLKESIVDLERFVSQHADINQRAYSVMIKDIQAGKPLEGVKKEFANLYTAAKEAYEGIGTAARGSSQEEIKAQKLRQTTIKNTGFLADQDKTFKAQKEQLEKQRDELFATIVKKPLQLPSIGVPPKLFDQHEKALDRYQASLERVKPSAQDLEVILGRIISNEGKQGLDKGQRDFYNALKSVLDIEGQIERQSKSYTAQIKAEGILARENAVKEAQALAAVEGQLKKTQAARTAIRAQVSARPDPKTFEEAAIQQPKLSKDLENQYQRLDLAVINAKTDIDAANKAIALTDNLEIQKLPKGLQALNAEYRRTLDLQDRLLQATEQSIVREERAKAAALARAKAVSDAEARIAQGASLSDVAREQLTKPIDTTQVTGFLDPKIIQQKQASITKAITKVTDTLATGKIGFEQYQEAMEASVNIEKYATASASTRKLADQISAAARKQEAFNKLIDQTIEKKKRESDAGTIRKRFFGPGSLEPDPTLPVIGVDPKLFQQRERAVDRLRGLVNGLAKDSNAAEQALALVGKPLPAGAEAKVRDIKNALEEIIRVESRIIDSQNNLTQKTKLQSLQRIQQAKREAAEIEDTRKRMEPIRADIESKRVAFAPTKKETLANPRDAENLRKAFLELDKAVEKSGIDYRNFGNLVKLVNADVENTQIFAPEDEPIRAALLSITAHYDKFHQRRKAQQKQLEIEEEQSIEKIAQLIARGETNRAKALSETKGRNKLQDLFDQNQIQIRPDFAQPLQDEIGRIQQRINTTINSVDGIKIGFIQTGRAVKEAFEPGVIANLTNEEKNLAKQIRIIVDEQKAFNAQVDVAKQKLAEQRTESERIAAGQAAIRNATSGISTTGIDEKKLAALKAAQQNVFSAFIRSGASVEQFDELLEHAGDDSALLDLPPKLEPLYRTLLKLTAAARNVDAELTKSGRTQLNDIQKRIAQEFIVTGAKPLKLQDIIDTSVKGLPSTTLEPEFRKIKEHYDELLRLSKEFAKGKKDEAEVIRETTASTIATLDAEIKKVAEREAKDKLADANREARRKKRQDARNAQRAAEIEQQTDERKELFPTIQRTLPPIKGFATAADTAATVKGYSDIATAAVNAGLKQQTLIPIINQVRAVLAQPANLQIFEPVAPAIERVREAIVRTVRSIEDVESPATRAGKGILISWQGVFRLFQAQVLHTALAQIIADFRQAVTEVGNYQREVALIQTITQNVSTNFDQWSESVTKLASQLGKTPTEIATAAYDSLSNQITTTKEETEAFVKTAGEFARVTGSSTPDAVNLLSSAIVSYSGSNSDAERIASKFFATIDLGRVRASDLANSLGRVTSLGGALGVSLDEVNASLVVLTQQGVKAPDALTQLNAVFQKLLKPTEATKELFKELGVTSGEALIAANGFGGALEIIAKAAADGKGDFSEFFNELRSARGGLTLAKNGAEQFKKALVELSKAEKSYGQAKTYAPQAPGVELQRQLNELSILITDKFGSAVAAEVIKITNSFGGLANIFKKTFEAIRVSINNAKEAIVDFGKALAIVGSAVGVYQVFTNIDRALTLVKVGFASLAPVVASSASFIATAFETHPIIAAATAAIAFGVALKSIITIYQSLKEAQFDAYKGMVDRVGENLEKITGEYKKAIGEQTEIQKKGIQAQVNEFAKLASGARQHLQDSLSEYKDFADAVRRGMEVAFEGATDTLKDGINDSESRIKDLKSTVEELSKFQADALNKADENAFKRKLETAPPQFKGPVLEQRINTLIPRQIELFNKGNYDEALKVAEEIFELGQQELDLFPAAFKAQQKAFNRQQVENEFRANKPQKIDTNRLALDEALKKQAELSRITATDEKQAIALREQRIEATQRLVKLQAQTFNRESQQNTIPKSLFAEMQKINQAYAAANSLGLTRQQVEARNNERLRAQLSIMEGIKESLADQIAQEETKKATQQAALRTTELLYEEFNKIRFFKPTGELISDEQLGEAKKKFDVLKGQLISSIQTAGEAGAIAPDKIGAMIKAVSDQANALEKAIASEVDQALKIDHVTKAEEGFKSAAETVSAEIGKQNTLLTQQRDLLSKNILEINAFAERISQTGTDLFDPSILKKIFDPFGQGLTLPKRLPESLGGLAGESEEAKKRILASEELLKKQEELRKFTTFDFQQPEGPQKAVKLFNEYKAAIEEIVRLFNRPDLLDAKIEVITPEGKTLLVSYMQLLDQYREKLAKIRDTATNVTNAETSIDQLKKITEARSLAPLVPEGGRIVRENGQTQILDALGNTTLKIGPIVDAYIKAWEQNLAKINAAGIPQRLQKELTIPKQLLEPFGLPKTPQEVLEENNLQKFLNQEKQIPKAIETGLNIDPVIEKLGEGVGTSLPLVFEEFESKTIQSINNVSTAIEGLSSGAMGLRSILATTVLGATESAKDLPINPVIDPINLTPQNLPVIPVVDPLQPLQLPITLNTQEMLTQYDAFKAQVQPVTVIDEFGTTEALNRIRNAQFAIPPVNINLGQSLIEVQNLVNALLNVGFSVSNTSGAFNTFASTGSSAVQSIANSINNILIPAIQNAQNALTQLNQAKAQAQPAQAKNTGGPVYLAKGGMVDVMLTPGEIYFPPSLAKKYSSQLTHMNKSARPKGTDTIPAVVPSGSFILNRGASEVHFPGGKVNETYLKNYFTQTKNVTNNYNQGGTVLGKHGIEYLQTGGMTLEPTNISQISTHNRVFKNTSTSTNNESLNIGPMTINLNGSNISTEQQALQLSKAFQRQLRLGRLKG